MTLPTYLHCILRHSLCKVHLCDSNNLTTLYLNPIVNRPLVHTGLEYIYIYIVVSKVRTLTQIPM